LSDASAHTNEAHAVEAATAIGYYAVPRGATSETAAEELDCATATAAEPLRKAEATVFRALLD
jgi:predicted DNA binding protein